MLHTKGGASGVVPLGMPGRGGISRGRGDAPMIWGEETPGRTDAFDAKALSPAERLDLENSQILGVGAAAPEVRPEAEGAGLVETGDAQQKSAWRRRLAPQHRQAVQQFFRPAGGKKTNQTDKDSP